MNRGLSRSTHQRPEAIDQGLERDVRSKSTDHHVLPPGAFDIRVDSITQPRNTLSIQSHHEGHGASRHYFVLNELSISLVDVGTHRCGPKRRQYVTSRSRPTDWLLGHEICSIS